MTTVAEDGVVTDADVSTRPPVGNDRRRSRRHGPLNTTLAGRDADVSPSPPPIGSATTTDAENPASSMYTHYEDAVYTAIPTVGDLTSRGNRLLDTTVDYITYGAARVVDTGNRVDDAEGRGKKRKKRKKYGEFQIN